MSARLADLHEVQKPDIHRAGVALADAFQDDHVWQMVFKPEATLEQRGTLFEVPVRYCREYGGVHAISKDLEGLAAWVPGELSHTTMWRLARTGGLLAGMRSLSACTKIARDQGRIFAPLEKARKHHMEGRSYLYLWVLGVSAELQGQGLGGRLMGALVEKSEDEGVPIYLETHTDENVRWYEARGFEKLDRVELPIIDAPHWPMVREPGA
jgi:ribosomal protein S18 acetylase RimI-like enzyme